MLLAVVALVWVSVGGLIGWVRSGLSLQLYLLRTTCTLYARLMHAVRIRHPLQLPAQGGALIVVNHTCSADAMFVQASSARPLTFLFAREYYDELPPFRWVFRSTDCVRVNRDSRDVQAARQALRRLDEGRVVCIFPEGNLSGAERGRMRRGKCGAAWLALRSKVPVYPAYISGGPQTSSIGRAWFFPSRACITFGPPLDLSAYRDRRITRALVEEIHELLMRRIAATELRPGREPSR